MTDEEQKTPFDTHPDDDTPAGDTPEHSDAEEGAPVEEGKPGDPPPAGRFKSGVVGGEAESDPARAVGDVPKPD